jgi:hypothetical protein
MPAYRHDVLLFIGSHVLKTTVDFNDDQTIPLLGRNGFFNHFHRVSLYELKRFIELEIRDK